MTVTKSKAEKTREVLSFLPRQDRHKPKGPEIKKSKMARWRAIVLIAVHVAIGIHIWHWLATGESMTPVEPSEAMETIELGRVNAGFILFLGLIASTVIFGRWFCGWACHVVALQDLSAWLLKKFGMQPRPVRSRLLVFAPWVVGFYMFLWPPLQAWIWATFQVGEPKVIPAIDDWTWEPTTTDLLVRFPGPWMAIGTFLVVGFLIVWWLGAKGFCTYGCPYGAFFSVADRVAPMRITVNDNCEHCGHCTTSCTSNVRVHEEVAKYGQVVDPGCMKCMDCVSVCPTDALSFGFAKPTPFKASQQRIKARADFAWWEEILMAAVAFVAVQWTFRGAWFGEGIPFLMAVGLGVITSVLVLLLVRLVVKKNVTFQHTALKQDGKRSTTGWVVMALLIGWVLFSAHTFVGHRLRGPAMEQAEQPWLMKFYRGEGDPKVLNELLEEVEAAADWTLLPDPKLREVRAMMRACVGRHDEAEAELTEMFEDYGSLYHPEAKMTLAQYFGVKGTRFEAAEALLIEVSTNDPNNPAAPRLLHRVRIKRGQ
ncbi:MAG: polyferredoxin [Planctomycetota bacterium]|jgi:polyferredoxin